MSLAAPLRRSLLLLLVVVSISFPDALTCQTTVGIQPFGSYTQGPDDINIGTLDMHLEIPIYSRKGRSSDTDISAKLVYDGGSLGSAGMIGTFNTGAGWQFEFSDGGGSLNTTIMPGTQCRGSSAYDQYYTYSYSDSSGYTHYFPASVYHPCSGAATPVNNIQASDGSGYSLMANASGEQYVLTPSGLHIEDGVPLTDTNGNTVVYQPAPNIGASPIANYLTQTGYLNMGETASNANSPVSDTQFQYVDANGATQTITIKYKIYPINPIAANSYLGYAVEIDSLILADGSAYHFGYEPSTLHPGTYTGRLGSIQLPTGGIISYQYTDNASLQLSNGSLLVGLTRTTADGTVTYTRNSIVTSNYYIASSDTTVSEANRTTSYTFSYPQVSGNYEDFAGAYETSKAIYQGDSATGTPLESITRCYNGATGDCTMQAITLPLTQISESTSYNGGPAKKTVTDYTPMGLVTEVDEYDYGSTIPSRKTQTQYANLGNGILDRPQLVTVSDGTGVTISKTTYGYDENDLSPTSNLSNHITIVGARGNLTSIDRWVNTTNTTLNTHFKYDDAGKLVEWWDAMGNPTQFTYDSASDQCLTNITLPTPSSGIHLATSATCDPTTELTTSTTDLNGQVTHYGYDAMLRPSMTSYPGGGSKTINYSGASLPETITTTVSAAPDPNEVSSVVLDGYGRISKTVSASGAAVDTVYDANGNIYSISNPYLNTQEQTYGITSYTYDALGRKRIETHPGNSTQQWSYAGNVTTFTDEAGSQWARTSDALGRLTNVTEPGGLQTTYTYNVLGDLLCADQWGTGTVGQPCNSSLKRSFAYDSLSRLTLATNPETGTVGYSYDANGNILSKTDARGIGINYSYDSLNRLTQKTYTDGTPAASYTYDNFTGWGQPHGSSVGKLVRSFTCNGTQCNDDLYSYDPMGRINHIEGATPSEAGHASHWTQMVYDLAGNMTQLLYPSGRFITQSYDGAGRLLNVNYAAQGVSPISLTGGTPVGSPYISNISYFPSGAPQIVSYGNGVTEHLSLNNRLQTCESYAFVPSTVGGQMVMDRQYFFTSATGSPCGTTSSNNGNIWNIVDGTNSSQGSGLRSQSFGYDRLNRITSWQTQMMAGSPRSQSYGYDSFGNMSPMNGSNPVYTFNLATNRINNLPCASSVPSPYDAAGNQICDTDINNAIRTYTFDAENRISSIAMLGSGTPFETYIYSGEGNRVRKNNANGTFTEYVYFNGQPIAEKDQSGTWTDHVYANGKKIASSISVDTRIHLSGTTIQAGSELGANIPFQSGYVVKEGDTFSWRQYNQNAVGGLNIHFSDGSWTGWHLQAYDGEDTGQDFTEGQWQYRTAPLNDYVGLTIDAIMPVKDVMTSPGTWSIYLGDIAIVSADGTVTHIFNGENSSLSLSQATDPAYESSFSAVVETVPISSDPTITNGSTMNATKFYLSDHLGTAQMEFASGGWPVWKGEFAPFGQELDTQFTANHYKFTGKERDTESGLDYFGARYYRSTIGRFTSPDSLGAQVADSTNPQSWNFYSYGFNNPVRFTDPTGHFTCTPATSTSTDFTATVTSGSCQFDFTDYFHSNLQSTISSPRLPPLPPSSYALNNVPSWYSNPCIQSALAKGAASTALDAVGLLPEGGVVASAFSLWRGAAGVSNGGKILERAQFGAALISTANAGSDAQKSEGAFSLSGAQAFTGAAAIGADLLRTAPVVGQVISGISVAEDLYGTYKAVTGCHT